jgi:hypothetical protein
MSGAANLDDEAWEMLIEAKSDLIKYLTRVSRLPPETVEDCVSDGMLDVATAYDPVAITTEANKLYVGKRVVVHSLVKRAAESRIGRERRRISKTVSDDTPIGEEDGDMHLRDLFVPRRNTPERVEHYAEWKMFARKGGCPLTDAEIESLFGFDVPIEL